MKTDLNKIREIAVSFLYLNIEVDERIPFVVHHPFTNSSVASIKVNNKLELVDLSIEENQNKWHKQFENVINESSLTQLFMMMNKPYRLTFLKYIMSYISKEDCGTILSTFWSSIEDISGDNNVSTRDIVKIFKYADKKTLLTNDDYDFYKSLPNNIILYRGVTNYNKDRRHAMSYTTDINVAKWFAKRFKPEGEIWKINIPKSKVLSVINSEEKEVIVDTTKSMKIKILEVDKC